MVLQLLLQQQQQQCWQCLSSNISSMAAAAGVRSEAAQLPAGGVVCLLACCSSNGGSSAAVAYVRLHGNAAAQQLKQLSVVAGYYASSTLCWHNSGIGVVVCGCLLLRLCYKGAAASASTAICAGYLYVSCGK
jgi:hypothetical protein